MLGVVILWSVCQIVLFFGFKLAPSGDLFSSGLAEIWGRMTDVSHYTLTLKTFAKEFFNFRRWGYNAPSFLLYYLVLRQKADTTWSRGLLAVLVMLVIQLLAYFAIYSITHHDLEWHLAFSLDRILLHIYPTALFLLFSVTVAPENILFPQKGATPFVIGTR